MRERRACLAKLVKNRLTLTLRNEVEAADETREALLAEYRAAVAAGPLSAEVEALQSIKGCGFALAAAFASEVGDFSRFRSGRQVTAYFGLATPIWTIPGGTAPPP